MKWKCSKFEFDASKPVIMGILNITPDSFSDGGNYLCADEAIKHAYELREQGAQIIDIGGESTRPGAREICGQEEWERIEKAVKTLSNNGFCISVDTRHAYVAQYALENGASIINDVSGFTDPKMIEVVKQSDCGLVVMHMRGTPDTMDELVEYKDVVDDVYDWLETKALELEKKGIDKERICLDFGPGFSKTPDQTLSLMRNFHIFRHLGYFLMCAPSRKRYLSELSKDNEELTLQKKDELTAKQCLDAAESGANVFRVHNCEETFQALNNLRPLVVLSLGSNVALVGDTAEEREESIISQLNMAIQELIALPDTQIVDISSIYKSKAAYMEDQDDFYNMAIAIRTGIPPLELLDYLHLIENSLGRIREKENGPRTIDIDIVDYQLYACESKQLTLPHKLALERDFVVKPVSEILPNHMLSNGRHIDEIDENERIGQATKLSDSCLVQ